MAAHAPWAEWNTDVPAYGVGVEEEVMLVDPQRRWALAQRIDDVLDVLPAALAEHVSAETHQAAIELRTDPHDSVGPAVAQLRVLRTELVETLGGIGLAAAGAGTHPTAVWSETEVTSASRYQLIQQTMRDLTVREPTFALHVHIGVPDPERAIDLYNRLRVHLPLLLALSGNSPFWRGRDAGFASTRTILFQAFPRTGMPRQYGSYSEWVEAVDLQIRVGALPEATFLWWDIRPQPRFGTVEIRIMDAQSRLAETATLVALVQSVARLELEEGYVSEQACASEEVLAENRFLAARDGVDARLIDPTAESLRPVTEILIELLDSARPHATALGCLAELERTAALAVAPGAARQRDHPSGPDRLERLVASLARAFNE
ncbi:MAG TPA: YbdK family carboxylate-amine ligase [Solirubrobacteraceae bacterium]|nr:YbdK family carboxylate-amine ligase [Solirubrobacteraceae bacterium]